MVLMPLVKNFCSITLDLLSPSQTQAKTLFKSAWSRSDGFLMICEWWWDQKVWLQWGWAFLFFFFLVTPSGRAPVQRMDENHSTHWKPSVSKNLDSPLCWQGSPTLHSDNQSALQHPIHLNMTDKEEDRETWVSSMGGGSATKMLSKKLSSPERCLHLTFKSAKGLTLIDSCFLLHGKHRPSGSPSKLN